MNLREMWTKARSLLGRQMSAVDYVREHFLPRHRDNALTALLGAKRHRKVKSGIRRRRPIHGPTFRYRITDEPRGGTP